jgi:O-6-methylguanine DNA methyltransferase
MDAQSVYYATVQLPVGRFLMVSTDRGLCRLILPGEEMTNLWSWLDHHFPKSPLHENVSRRDEVAKQLGAYFRGELRTFDLKLDLRATPFQQAVLKRIAEIPCGQTRSYSQIAKDIGRPQAPRAVGAATGSNPIPIVIPCHRVVGADGRLVGFGGGLPFKVMLLKLEGHDIKDLPGKEALNDPPHQT